MKPICEAAKKAGEIAMHFFEKELSIKTKSMRADVVTQADVECQKAIVEVLRKYYPGATFVLEEGCEETGIPSAETVFVVDPIDGTLNYSHSLPYFAVSVARLSFGKIVEGAIYIPFTDEMFYAELGRGALLNDKRIVNEKRPTMDRSLLVTGWPYDETKLKWSMKSVEKLSRMCQEVRIIGSSALELCYLACGRFDGYWEVALKPWDMAAGVLIAQEAGVVVGGLNGEFDLESGEIIAAVPSIFEQLRSALVEL
ncbi:MAG: Inositol-phosphate phosphatase [Thermotoga sp. 50_1627]|uniref:inositol monophosphatase family protein n=1 Tax=Pseudothermotoga sp. TaxID=2033661 RepID=UPI00076DEC1E|nr:MAG: Inositol-phosphate phosphatase [Thermotoga sp. 50_64]KUK25642.1 MAG: Inositol-phosphate phosphatase [Thermotoga sp. 50_1627]MBC7115553.1 inositol monophosphatase [Pseudothermotoga sp.]MDK2923049.1 monophosphatase [Pseudothermotoga sp.]HBT40029.1 inositol monophosphatase [Pseudothermotoga sp.]